MTLLCVALGRSWAQQIQARYQMFNPDAARPARRIYIGGLPLETTDVRPHRHPHQPLLRHRLSNSCQQVF